MSTSRTMAWISWIIASTFYAYQYILRVMPNIMFGDITKQFNIDAATFGQFSGVYYIGYALMHLPLGIMLDRVGPRKVMTGCILLTVIGLLPILFSDHWIYPILGRALIGIGSSAAILGTFKIIRMNFEEKRFTRMLSLSVTIGLIGAIYGGGPVSYLSDYLGYKAVVEIFIGLGVLLSVATYFITPDIKTTLKGSMRGDIAEILRNPKIIILCISAGLLVSPLEGFADGWSTEFLKQVYGLDKATASSIPSMIFMGMCFGGPFLSFIAEKTNRYLATIIGAGVVMAISFFILITGVLTTTSMSIVFALVGVCCAYQILAIYKASTYAKEQASGLTTAIANMIIMIFGYVFHTIIGATIHGMGGPTSTKAFIYGVGVVPVAVVLGIGGFLYVSFLDRKKSHRR